MLEGWDNLRLCRVCGDRETTSEVCWACREQQMIDDSDWSPVYCPDCKSSDVLLDFQENLEHFTCQQCGKGWITE